MKTKNDEKFGSKSRAVRELLADGTFGKQKRFRRTAGKKPTTLKKIIEVGFGKFFQFSKVTN